MITRFITHISKNKGYSPNTARAYEKNLRAMQTWLRAQGVTRWSQVEKKTLEKFVTDMVDAGARPATIAQAISSVRSLFQYFREQGLTDTNPAKYVSTPKIGHALPYTIPVEDIKATMADPTTDATTRALLAMLTETGIRLQEALDIRTQDIDTTTHSIRIQGKGKKQRVVYYGSATQQALEALQPYAGGHVIPVQQQREVRWQMWHALHRHSNARQLSPHALRHTFATQHVQNGTGLETIAKMLGHQSVTTTEIYAEASNQQAAAAFRQGFL